MFERPAEKPAPAEIVTEAPAVLFDWESVTLLPPARINWLPVMPVVPVVFPPNTPAEKEGIWEAAEMVIAFPFCDNVMLLPPAKVSVPLETLAVTPATFPPGCTAIPPASAATAEAAT